jgi:hypothetical protein
MAMGENGERLERKKMHAMRGSKDLYSRILGGIEKENVKDLQAKDNDLKEIIKYLRDQTLPYSQKESRKLLLEAADYILVDGILFHSNLSKSNRRKTKIHQHYQLVVPKLMIKLVLQMYHDSPMGGHSGIKNTIDRVWEFYFFQRLPTIVAEYVKSCHKCQIRKTSSFHTKAGIFFVSYTVRAFSSMGDGFMWSISSFFSRTFIYFYCN